MQNTEGQQPASTAATSGAPLSIDYVAGFMFDPAKTRVALIRKCKPTWQAGLLNGIGGKIEPDEPPVAAMVREFEEETGVLTCVPEWKYFLWMRGPDWSVYFFTMVGDVDQLRSAEPDERVEIHMLTNIDPLRGDMIENLPWLIPLALDSLNDGRPSFVEAHYP